jgi:hypothetical protein
MKKLIPILLLAGSLMLTGCGDSNGINQVSGQQGNNGGFVPPPPPPPPVTQGFFVDGATGNDATGDFATGSPFATVQGAVAAAPNAADVVVRPGNYTGAVTLKDGQRLLGSGSVLAQGAARPVLGGPINLANGNTVDFIEVRGTAGDAIVADGRNGGTITNCVVANTTIIGPNTGSGVEIENSSGNWEISDNTLTNIDSIAIEIDVSGTATLVARLNRNDIAGGDSGTIAILTENAANVRAQVHDNSMLGSACEFISGNSSTLSLDFEDNATNANIIFSLIDTAVLNVEQLAVLTTPKPAGAGNTGTVQTPTTRQPTDVPNGFAGF